jgi:hypothetical protein
MQKRDRRAPSSVRAETRNLPAVRVTRSTHSNQGPPALDWPDWTDERWTLNGIPELADREV